MIRAAGLAAASRSHPQGRFVPIKPNLDGKARRKLLETVRACGAVTRRAKGRRPRAARTVRQGRAARVIVADTSALMAIILGGAEADACIAVLELKSALNAEKARSPY